jgi:hypothetical protein
MSRSWLSVTALQPRRRISMKRMLGLTLAVAVAASFAVAAQAGLASGGSSIGDRNQRSADVTFTKWLTSVPNAPSAAGASMAGVVGGDVGPGFFMGKVLSEDTSQSPIWLARALYGFNGRKHPFLAYNHITENAGTATIRGVVIAGWMKGARVTGQYTVWETCPIPTPRNVFGDVCFQGTLHLQL